MMADPEPVCCRYHKSMNSYNPIPSKFSSLITTYKTIQKSMKSAPLLTACLALTFAFAANAADVTGTWKSSTTNQTGQARETIFKLKAEGEKLTGTVSGRNNDTAIEAGKIKGDEVSFQVIREFNGNTMTNKYTGKISGDTITGKSESEREGQPQSRDWTAKREIEAKAPAK